MNSSVFFAEMETIKEEGNMYSLKLITILHSSENL